MQEVFIKYNPYTVTTEVTIDGEKPRENSRLNVGGKRLQEWVEKLPDILKKELFTDKVKLKFYGTQLDFEDIENVVGSVAGIHIEVEHINKGKESRTREDEIKKIFDEIQECPFDEFKELKSSDLTESFNSELNKEFRVNVVATMSAGKSTLINTLLGKELMPTKNEACTAKITEIKDNDKANFTAKVYDENENFIKAYSDLTLEDMDELNENHNVFKISIEGDIPFVDARDNALVLVDTPGPNSAANKKHQEITYEMIGKSSKSVVLYIMNGTVRGINDDAVFLEFVSESMKVGGKQSKDRFIFVVNKLDEVDPRKNEIPSLLANVKKDLQKLGIEDPNIYPASALTALGIRTILSGTDAKEYRGYQIKKVENNVAMFNEEDNLHLEKYASLTKFCRDELERELKEAIENQDVNKQALIHCGIVPIELAIKQYIEKYAEPMRIKNIVDTFEEKVKSITYIEKLKEKRHSNEEEWKRISRNMEIIKGEIDKGEVAKEFKKDIEGIDYSREIEKKIEEKRNEFQKRVTEYFEKYRSECNQLDYVGASIIDKKFQEYSDDIMMKLKTDLKNIIEDDIIRSVSDILERFKAKFRDLCPGVEDIGFDINKIMKGYIENDPTSFLASCYKQESIKTGQKEFSGNWDSFSGMLGSIWGFISYSDKYWKDIYETKEYYDGISLLEKRMAVIEEHLRENSERAQENTKSAIKRVKDLCLAKVEELNEILKRKTDEFKQYEEDAGKSEETYKELQKRIEWLEDKQSRINDILDI